MINSFRESSNYNNNIVTLHGTVTGEPEISHELYGEKYYNIELKVRRLSSRKDYIPITISEKLIRAFWPVPGDFVKITGQYRSYNNYTGVGNKLILTVFAKSIKYLSKEQFDETDINPNQIYLNGYLCKKPTYRTTPSNREISDILIAVNRFYNKSDYIPCIAWGINAQFAKDLEVGTNIIINGRIQSREYQKKLNEFETLNKTAYEVSITTLELGT
ncbi:MAG TPA: single-stranded DNA-binding protein [Candidatus Monoglobus merdigallinarum]|uniref:Single-stranded DNA-binding protein n=1 Tax=Candidatus Monoglobus merdigallinarum TaxID=2838698 RepID=A0A9D1PR45_9FIRM|nr:single-stranded DNA-binding protein [Candidatus Monoglobus merdigallinarum]